MAPREIIDGFMAIKDNASRRAVLNEIMDNLRWHERREVKSWAENWTFQCDILGNLPLEMVALTVQYLDLKDIFVLRRVSKLWYGMLTSTTVLSTATGRFKGNNVIQSGTSHEMLEKLILKRVRAENAMPAVVATFPNNLSASILNDAERDAISIFNGVCAWIEESTNRTSIFLLHLQSGKTSNLTTENREGLTHIKVSDTLVSAVSIRGYCHVWKIATEEYKCFRIPSQHFFHYVSYGSKVLLSYMDSVVHFNFDTRTARYVAPGHFMICVSVHPVQDEFSVICVRGKNMDNHPIKDEHNLHVEKHRLQIQKFSVCDNEFVCTCEQYQELPFRRGDTWELHDSRSPHPGQSSTLMTPALEVDFEDLSFSLEVDDRITVHLEPHKRDELYSNADLDYSRQGPGLIYDFQLLGYSSYDFVIRIAIGAEYPERLDVCPDANVVGFQAKFKNTKVDAKRDCRVVGDGDFVLFYRPNGEIWVWCFDETWLPSGIPGIEIRGRFGMQEDWEKCRRLPFQ